MWAQNVAGAEDSDHFEPQRLEATLYNITKTNQALFTFLRTATRDADRVNVVREFRSLDGTLVAREEVEYQRGQLLRCTLDEPLSGAQGTMLVEPDPKNPERKRTLFTYRASKDAKTKTNQESFDPDTLVSDSVADFIIAHLEELERGEAVKARFAALARLETIGFKFVKEHNATWNEHNTLIIRMEPSNWLFARLVDPLRFTVEKEGSHRVFAYEGRTTPRELRGKEWHDLDAWTVFDWKSTE